MRRARKWVRISIGLGETPKQIWITFDTQVNSDWFSMRLFAPYLEREYMDVQLTLVVTGLL